MARSCCCSHTQFSVSSSRLFLLSFTASAVFSPAHAHLRYRKSQLVCSSSAIASAAAAAAAKSRVVVAPPPEDYDFRAETRLQTVETVRTHFPQLMDLVEDGTLVVVKRAVDYVERRSDGYVEPEVVFVVGTAHMSRVSALQVTRVVNAVQPENVVVELCRSRSAIMYDVVVPAAAPITESNVANLMQGQQQQQQQNPNLMSMSGENFGSAVSRSLELGGRSALVLRLLLGAMSKRISSSAGVATGEEFRAACKAAEEIGAQIVLGDRPIEITLQRAWDALRWDESLRLAMTFIQAMTASNLDASEETLEALRTDDALSAMFKEMGHRFPSLLQPLIHERDMYLAWSLKRSKAVNGSRSVVGVVGKGHLRGIVHALMHNQEQLRFKDLVGARGSQHGGAPRRGQQISQILQNLAIETTIGGLIWWAWDSLHQ